MENIETIYTAKRYKLICDGKKYSIIRNDDSIREYDTDFVLGDYDIRLEKMFLIHKLGRINDLCLIKDGLDEKRMGKALDRSLLDEKREKYKKNSIYKILVYILFLIILFGSDKVVKFFVPGEEFFTIKLGVNACLLTSYIVAWFKLFKQGNQLRKDIDLLKDATQESEKELEKDERIEKKYQYELDLFKNVFEELKQVTENYNSIKDNNTVKTFRFNVSNMFDEQVALEEEKDKDSGISRSINLTNLSSGKI